MHTPLSQVSDYTLEAAVPAGEEKGSASDAPRAGDTPGASSAGARETAEERCRKYALWKTKYDAHFMASDGAVEDGFYDFLAAQYEPFGSLAKLRAKIKLFLQAQDAYDEQADLVGYLSLCQTHCFFCSASTTLAAL